MQDGDLVLIDAGCEFQGYAADITRTFPVNGRFSAEQRAIYDVVLKSQLAAIAATKPGKKWNHPHDVTVRVITEGLVELGLLSGDVDELIESGAYTDFYMHRAGHWLALMSTMLANIASMESGDRLSPVWHSPLSPVFTWQQTT